MKIEPPADDLGLQKLKAADRARGKVAQVDHVEPSARIAPSQERRESVPVGPERREGERRSGQERRQQRQPHLIDTREPHERRVQRRRDDDRVQADEHETDESGTPTGIDVRA